MVTSRPSSYARDVTPASPDPARDDLVERGCVRIHVQGEAVHRDALGDPDPHGADLPVLAPLPGVGGRVLGPFEPESNSSSVSRGSKSRESPPREGRAATGSPRTPDARPALHPAGLDAELGADPDHDLFEPPQVRHHVHRARQLLDRVAHELPGPVPGDLAAAVHVDHGRAVEGSFAVRRSPARRVDRRVLQSRQVSGTSSRKRAACTRRCSSQASWYSTASAPNPMRTNRNSLTASASLEASEPSEPVVWQPAGPLRGRRKNLSSGT